MSMREAKDLHADITKLLLVLQTLQEKNSSSINDKNINVELRGDTW